MKSVMTKEVFQFTKKPSKTLVGLCVTSLPNKVEYNYKESIDLTGLEVYARYDDDTVKNVTDKITTSPTEGVNLIAIPDKVFCYYTEGDITVSTHFHLIGNNITWADGTDEEIVEMVEAADRGEINLADYWKVGDERVIDLSSTSDTYGTFVLMNKGGKELVNPTIGGRTECSFIVGMKERTVTMLPMSDKWSNSYLRNYLNGNFRGWLSESIRSIFKLHKTVTDSADIVVEDYFVIPAAQELMGNDFQYNFEADLKQFEYYKKSTKRLYKYLTSKHELGMYVTRSSYTNTEGNYRWFYVFMGTEPPTFGSGGYNGDYSFSPFGVI